MGFRCDRCAHEWIPRDLETEPRVCPKCKSPYWNVPRRIQTSYEQFKDAIRETIIKNGPLTWTQIRTLAKLPQAFPNNVWVRRMETDIKLRREKDHKGIILWRID
jgi:predicted Zn-dependent protease